MKQQSLLFTIILFAISCNSILAQSLYSYVDPFIGSVGKGNVFVGAVSPFGMCKPGPDCDVSANSGYNPDMSYQIYGFSQTHVSGTGGGPKYGNVSIMPFGNSFDQINQESPRENEVAQAGYYGVNLKKWGIQADVTTSSKVAFYRFIYSDNIKGVKIDLGKYLGEEAIPDGREAQQFVGSEVEIINDKEIRGYTRIRGGWNNGKAYTVYFCAVFDTPFNEFGTWKGSEIFQNEKTQYDNHKKTGAYVMFDEQTSSTVNVKIGISFLSSLKAAQNIKEEIPHWDFDKTLQETQERWENLLCRIEIDKNTPEDYKTMFYTGLYHTMLMPVNRTGENPLWKSSKPYYDDFYAIWDTYRTSHPLITLIAPDIQADIINALIDIYKYDDYMPDARSGNSNGRTQGGSNAEVMIADAFVKDLTGISYGQALFAMLKDAQMAPGSNQEAEGRGGLEDYNSLGYVSNRYVRAGNRTLEYAFNDYCLAQVAKGKKRLGEYHHYIAQSNNWKNLWRDIESDGSHGFIMPRDANGKWIDSIPCTHSNGQQQFVHYTPVAQEWPICVCWWCGFFYEGNSWEYSFFVPHNVPELIKMCGGKEAFQKRLDTFFEKEYYRVGNEPSFLTPLLYHWINEPALSSDRIHRIVNKYYNASRSGIPGNDDSGAMSSRLAFHMMGFYPNAGMPYYLITTPFLKKTTLHLNNGKDFSIIVKNLSDKNLYIKKAFLNGEEFDQSWILHQQIMEGGELILELSSESSEWGKKTPPPTYY